MSAFMLSKEHIDALVSVAAFGPKGVVRGRGWYPPLWGEGVFSGTDVDDLGQAMVSENLKSIQARYPDTITNPDDTPGPVVRYWERPYSHRDNVVRMTPVEALKALACYEYQTCEHRGWEGSSVWEFCRSLRHSLIAALPGYEDAPWEWTSEQRLVA